MGKYLSIPATKKCSGRSFIIVFPVAPTIVQVWEEKALESEVRTEKVDPVSTKKFSDLPATSSCTFGSSLMMIICDRGAG